MPKPHPIIVIFRAIDEGDLKKVIRLIEKNKSLLHGWTPLGTLLHYAASEGQLEIVKWLVEQGLDVNAYNDSHESPPLCRAASKGHIEVVQFLIESGAVLDTSDSVRNPLLSAIVNYDVDETVDVARLLIDSGIDTSVIYEGRDEDIDALGFARDWGRTEIVKLLEDSAKKNKKKSAPPKASPKKVSRKKRP